jgi:HK97 family phage major capsid protein
MKKSEELKQKRTALEAKMAELTSKAERTAEDNSAFDQMARDIDALDLDIAREERIEKMAIRHVIEAPNIITEKKSFKDYSFRKAIFETAYRGGLTGLEKEMHEEAVRQNEGVQGIGVPDFVINSRADLAATSSKLVATDTKDFIDSLKARLVVVQAGARVMTGLKGNLSIPRLTSGAVGWASEVDNANDFGASFDNVEMSPKRLTAYQTMSKQLLIQSSYDVEAILRNDMINAVALGVDAAAIYGGAASTPTGILATSGIGSVTGGTTGAAPTWANIVALEREVAVDNADLGSLAFLTNPKVRAKLKSTAVGNDQRMVWAENGNTLMGYPAYVTTQVPSTLNKGATTGVCSAIIFGNFSDLMIGQWNGLDIIVDPYTAAKNAQVNVFIHSWWDVAVRHAQSFAAMLDALTT